MEKFKERLRRLFDAQDFFADPRLDKAIGSERAEELPDDEIGFLAAAGDPFVKPEEPSGGK